MNKTAGSAMLALGGLLGWIGANSAITAQAHGRLEVGPGTAVMSVVSTGNENVIYVLDPSEKAISVYKYDPRKEKLKLSAARWYSADHRLSEYNNEGTSVADIERMTRQR
jgi:hypothetical protein